MLQVDRAAVCSVEVVLASELPVLHLPVAGRGRLPDGGPCIVEVDLASKLTVGQSPAACRGRLSDGCPCSVDISGLVYP